MYRSLFFESLWMARALARPFPPVYQYLLRWNGWRRSRGREVGLSILDHRRVSDMPPLRSGLEPIPVGWLLHPGALR
ncbi:MAG TPA: hypothetical protein VGD08_24235 [Stellaceae bacterium]|jgi:hypothetical protein